MVPTTPYASVHRSECSTTAPRASPIPGANLSKGAGDLLVQVQMVEGAPEVAAATKIRLGTNGDVGNWRENCASNSHSYGFRARG